MVETPDAQWSLSVAKALSKVRQLRSGLSVLAEESELESIP